MSFSVLENCLFSIEYLKLSIQIYYTSSPATPERSCNVFVIYFDYLRFFKMFVVE